MIGRRGKSGQVRLHRCDQRREAQVIRSVERDYSANIVSEHRGDNCGIVNLLSNAGNALDQLDKPIGRTISIANQGKAFAELADIGDGMFHIEPKSIDSERAGRNDQIFAQDLLTDDQADPLRWQFTQDMFKNGAVMFTLGRAGRQQDIRIDE
jgi:hypothetical protein